mmetsp:Transcript_20066/g.43921  ORF Transcript_20066/g.43921 Transcript_20066/m.43921 type:complete len:360 (-) Transcript_20066:787-1866(-)
MRLAFQGTNVSVKLSSEGSLIRLPAGRLVTCHPLVILSAEGRVTSLRGGMVTVVIPYVSFAAHSYSTTGRCNIHDRNWHLDDSSLRALCSRVPRLPSSSWMRASRLEHAASSCACSRCSRSCAAVRSISTVSMSTLSSLRRAAASRSAAACAARRSSISVSVLASCALAACASCWKRDFCRLHMCVSFSAFAFSLSFSSSSSASRLGSTRASGGRLSRARIITTRVTARRHRRRARAKHSARYCAICSPSSALHSRSSFVSRWMLSCSGLSTRSCCRASTVLSTPWRSTSMGFMSDTVTGSSVATNLESSTTSISEFVQNCLNQSADLSMRCGLAELRENCSRTAGRIALEKALVLNSF